MAHFFLYAFCSDLDKITYSNNESLFILIILSQFKNNILVCLKNLGIS